MVNKNLAYTLVVNERLSTAYHTSIHCCLVSFRASSEMLNSDLRSVISLHHSSSTLLLKCA